LIEIFVDGDACPVKDETCDVAIRYGVRASLLASSQMSVPAGLGVEVVVVEPGPDSADDWIAEHARPGDVVVTADIPLAARCLAAGTRVLGTNGRAFTEDSIGQPLASRDLNAHLRESGMTSGGTPPLAPRDRSRFLSKLDELIRAGLRELRRSQQGWLGRGTAPVLNRSPAPIGPRATRIAPAVGPFFHGLPSPRDLVSPEVTKPWITRIEAIEHP